MSSQLTNLVPVLDGTNYQQWSTAMQSFLMSQGQWKCTKDGAEALNTTTTVTEVEGGPSVSVTAGKEEIASWNEDAEKALGNIHLHTIGYQFNDVTNLSTLWETVRNVTKIPLFSPNFFQLLNLCFVILFCSPSLC